MTVSDVDEPITMSTLVVVDELRRYFGRAVRIRLAVLVDDLDGPELAGDRDAVAECLATPAATHFDGSPKAAIGPVSGVTMPILTTLLAARDDWNVHGDAMALTPPAAANLRMLRLCLSTFSPRLTPFTPHFVFITSSLYELLLRAAGWGRSHRNRIIADLDWPGYGPVAWNTRAVTPDVRLLLTCHRMRRGRHQNSIFRLSKKASIPERASSDVMLTA